MTDDEKIALERQAERSTLAGLRSRAGAATDAFFMSAMIINLHEVMGVDSYRARETKAALAHVQDQAQQAIALIQEIAKACNDIESRRG